MLLYAAQSLNETQIVYDSLSHVFGFSFISHPSGGRAAVAAAADCGAPSGAADAPTLGGCVRASPKACWLERSKVC